MTSNDLQWPVTTDLRIIIIFLLYVFTGQSKVGFIVGFEVSKQEKI